MGGGGMRAPAWREACRLREDIRSGDLTLAEFAADLQGVRTATGPLVYREPRDFFARTYPTHNLRVLVREVLQRLAGRAGQPVVRMQVAYGGGKTHALLTLLHLAERGAELGGESTVQEFLRFAGLEAAPQARVAILPFDKFDVVEGLEVRGPDGRTRRVLTPWGALAYQLGGDAGFARVAQHEADYLSPAEPVLDELLAMPEAQGMASLVLVDEAVWYCREAMQRDSGRLGVLRDFFHALTQAVARRPRAALVAALVSSAVEAHDPNGMQALQALEAIFGRVGVSAEPVAREDVAEILRRRLFEAVPAQATRRAAADAFFARLGGLPVRDSQKDQAAYDRLLASYPFHPDLIDVLFQKWTQLPGQGFQRTRGALRLMARALRESESQDDSVWVGPAALLGPGIDPSPALGDLISQTPEGQDWLSILTGELGRALDVQNRQPALAHREMEQAVVATFLHSQPAGQSASEADLWSLLCHPALDGAAMEEGLRLWRQNSWFLVDDERVWRLGTVPNLTAMHLRAMERVTQDELDGELKKRVRQVEALSQTDAGIRLHLLPETPADVPDSPELHYLILGPEAAVGAGQEPPAEVRAFFAELRPGNPRTFVNAVLALAPESGRVAALREQVRRVLGWRALPSMDGFQQADERQRQAVKKRSEEEERRIPDAVLASYVLLLAMDSQGKLQVQSLPSGQSAPFDRVKRLLQQEERLMVSRLDPLELLPEGGLQLWPANEAALPVARIVGSFYQFPRLPRLLSPQVIWDSIRAGVEEGTFCLRLARPDGTARVWWREAPSDADLRRPEAELCLLSQAPLDYLRPELLLPGVLPELWPPQGDLPASRLRSLFDGKRAPALAEGVLERAVGQAVLEGLVALYAGGRLFLGEDPHLAVLPVDASIQRAPEPLRAEELLPALLPGAWGEDGTTTLADLLQVVRQQEREVPWRLLEQAVGDALEKRILELEPDSATFPCPPADAAAVHLGLPKWEQLRPEELVSTAAQRAWEGGRARVREIARALEGGRRRIPLEVLHRAVEEAVSQGLVELGGGARLPEVPGQGTLAVMLRRPSEAVAVDGELTGRDLQTLARIWPEMQRLAPQADMTCYCSLTIRGELPAELKGRLGEMLRKVKDDWRL